MKKREKRNTIIKREQFKAGREGEEKYRRANEEKRKQEERRLEKQKNKRI